MDFKDQYNISSDGKLYINAKIMSHSSATANVTVVLQDQNGNQVYRKQTFRSLLWIHMI